MKFHEAIARRKLGVGPEWEGCLFKRIGPDATSIEGGVPSLLKSGKRKGKKTWAKAGRSVCIVTDIEVKAEQICYEADTGLCHRCLGERQTVQKVSVIDGTTYRICTRCVGTGQAPKRTHDQD